MKKFFNVVFSATLISLVACSTTGKIGADGSITSSDGRITCRLPEKLLSPHIVNNAAASGTYFSVTDDFGRLYRVDTLFPPLPLEIQKLDQKAALDVFADRMLLPTFRSVSPATRITSRKYLEKVRGGALYLVVRAPGTSVLVTSTDGKPGKRGDSIRHVLLFFDGPAMVSVMHNGMEVSKILAPAANNESRSAQERSHLLQFAQTVRVK